MFAKRRLLFFISEKGGSEDGGYDRKRTETRAFAKLNNFIPGSKCILITNSEETNLEYDGINIEVIPIWKWLLMADL